MWSVRSIGTIFVVAGAALILPFAGYAALHKTPVPNAGVVPGGFPANDPTGGAPTDSNTAAATGSDVSGSTVIAFLGDDYTTGAGASRPVKRFSTILATKLGCVEANFGAVRTGYARVSDTGGGDYTTRVAKVVAANPAVIIVSGGRNDVGDDRATFASKANELFADLRSGLPRAKIIAVAPWWGDSAPRAAMADVAASIKSAVQAVGGTYLDVPDPLFGHSSWMADDADPNDLGYAAIAASLKLRVHALLSAG